MEAYVKAFSDYKTIKKGIVLTHSLVVDSADSERSSLQLIGTEVNRGDVGNWLIVDGAVYQISGVKPQNGLAVLTLQAPIDAFATPVEYDADGLPDTAGAFVASALEGWIHNPDPVYAVPYVEVTNTSRVPFVAPELQTGNLFDLPTYCRLLRKTQRMSVSFQDGGKVLRCIIRDILPSARQISLEDGRSQLISAEYGKTGVAKITVLHDTDTGQKDTDGNAIYSRDVSDWYLARDGSVSQDPPQHRARGEWRKLHITGDADIREKVIEEFAKNETGHKVEFRSDIDLAVLDTCAMWLDGELLTSRITYKRKDSGDRRFFYRAGDLATTAAEKLKGMRL